MIEQAENDSVSAWEDGALGEDGRFAVPLGPDESHALDDTLGLQVMSIRMPKDLVQQYEQRAKEKNVECRSLMRDVLSAHMAQPVAD